MADRAFLIIAECLLQTLPTAGDIKEIEQRLATARAQEPSIRNVTVRQPAVVRHGRYALLTEFAVGAGSKEEAEEIVRKLLRSADISCESVYFSGRILSTQEPGAVAPASTPSAPAADPAGEVTKPERRKKATSGRGRTRRK
ncbi:MAG: hypothetical protein QN198_09675 [Armatimonadota bacterium]|nr:hypothetical protein [Armatimonadota bacterium]MDR5703856.1 hypothetical protein [Armatimonadota bacterium]